MKIGIYTPYLDSFGGGERYMLTIAEILSSDNDVDLLLDKNLANQDSKMLICKLSKHLNLDLKKLNLVKAPIGAGGNAMERIFFLKKYDLLFYLTDGSFFYSTAKKNIIHFQVPFENLDNSYWSKFKLSSWTLAIYNSEFTKDIIEKNISLPGEVVYPPVAVEDFKPLSKKKQILSVGRFYGYLKTKKHEEMITTFINLYKHNDLKGWSLYLAGSLIEGDESYLDELKDLAKNYPIYFYPNIKHDDLRKLYGESSIYWHAAGLNETNPEKMEHFGISTVEAMAAGCVPVVINKGGQPEIVEDQVSGFLWNDLSELENLTLKLIENDTLKSKVTEKAIERSSLFSKMEFKEHISKIIYA